METINTTAGSNNAQPTNPKYICSTKVNKVLYASFVVLGIYFLIKGDAMSAASNVGVALVFDPFDQTVMWKNRPLYQRALLFVQVSIVLSLFVYGIVYPTGGK
ncbi:hypothetical protein [Parasediminibacterium sp. JCM 36343]|uniref:hypothetical protein n=1 Tax=Parasediminibacterium sp. JCM 36343 TaxID=3374279 RepID=UPI00397E6D02